MSHSIIPDEASDLFEKLRHNKVTLFIGNGASIDAGGPSTVRIVTDIKSKFKNATYSSNDFIQTCTDVMETSLTSRKDLDQVIVQSLYDLKPSTFHLELPLSIWPAIFTTNYDDLIEKAYRAVEERVQIADPVFSRKDPLALHDIEKVKIFKLMGCIISQHPENKLIITREDYNWSLKDRGVLFKTLRDIMRDGTILYIGYSFNDYLLSDIFSDLIREIGLQNLPYSYALMPDIDPASVQAIKLREKKVIPLRMTATQFIELKKGIDRETPVPLKDKSDVRVTVKNTLKKISHRDARQYTQEFDFLSEDVLMQKQPDEHEIRRDFFRGLIKDWTGYTSGWDFKRNQFTDIFAHVKDELLDPDVGKNKSLMIFGPAGSGKTVLLHRIAYDAYRNLGNPVVILRPYYEDLDLKLLSTLCEELATLEKGIRSRTGVARARVLIIMESAAAHVADFKMLPVFLKSRGIPVLLLASTRENDWEIVCQQSLDQTAEVKKSITLSDTFESENERLAFARHLKSLDIIEASLSDDFISDFIQKDCHNSFFASVYSLIEPSRPTLEEKIDDEFLHLSDLAKRAYSYVSLLYQYSLPIPIELLVRTLNCSYELFLHEIYGTEAKKVICEVPGPNETVYLGARHRIVAEKIVERQIHDLDKIIVMFKELLRNLNSSNIDEILICRSLLIRYLGPNGVERRFSQQQIRDIFTTAIDEGGIKDPSVLHHFGLFESDSQNHERGISLVKEALDILKQRYVLPFSRTERVENLYNTLGVIYSKIGQAAEAGNDNIAAESAYSSATDYFSKAKGSVSPNPYPYDSECRMYLNRAERATTLNSKLTNYLSALTIVYEAEDNLAEEDLPRVLELKARIQEGIKNIESRHDIRTNLLQNGTPQDEVELIEARLSLLDKTPSLESLKRAFDIVKKAVDLGMSNVATLKTYTKLHLKLYPDDKETYYNILKNRYRFAEEQRNLSLLYELGKLSFTFGDYEKSKEYFSALEKISQGHPKRWGIRDRGLTPAGGIVEFSGTVIRFDSSNLGYVDIPEIRRRVPFLPYAQKYQPQIGDNVTFKIGFNYRGWLAIDLSR